MALSIELIKQLRQTTGAGVQDCRKALEQANSEYGKALGILRNLGLEKAAKHNDKATRQGMIELYSHGNGRVGVMIEINTETDFGARSKALRAFAHEIALQIAAEAPQYVQDEDIPAHILEKQAAKAAQRAQEEGKPETIIPRIVEGYLKKFKDKNVLLRQVYIRDDGMKVAHLLAQTIANIGENITIRRFIRWEIEAEST